MSQSLTKIYVHIVFHIKSTTVPISSNDKPHLYSYIRTVLADRESIPIEINGTSDHIHILCLLSKNIAISKLVEDIKRHSSRWIKTLDDKYSRFAWQRGYAAFSVSQSVLEKTINYIKN
ncbi:transposase [Tenuifilum osseticum]|uniref:transposase n=1 Tax=Tenuifilum osseticum TaxID=3374723 RepID=UPI0034E5BF40